MSAKQMAILTATVVALIVIVTLIKVGMGGRGSDDPVKPSEVKVLTQPHLTFTRAIEKGSAWAVPGPPSRLDDMRPPDEEVKREGHYDFWFTNENDAAVEVFLTHLSCSRCLNVKVGLAPPGWQAALAAGAVASGGLPAVAQATVKTPDPGPDVAWEALELEEGKPGPKGFTVPPKGAGWVRLGWKDEQPGLQTLSAGLRTASSAGDAPHISLEYLAFFIEPVRVRSREIDVGTLRSGDSRPREASFTVYSSTRERFDLVPESDDEQNKHPFVTCGKPVPLTGEECRKLEKELKSAVLCGYKVPVTVRERLKEDGPMHDLGPFRTTVVLTSDDTDSTIGLSVIGTVQGDLRVVGGGRDDLMDRVVFDEPFPRSSGASKTVTVEAEPGTTLQLDKVPEFMKAELKAEPQGPAVLRKTWSLTVTIKPNTVLGHFPQPDDPTDSTLRDTAIYLRANGRRVRIPVSGTASQR